MGGHFNSLLPFMLQMGPNSVFRNKAAPNVSEQKPTRPQLEGIRRERRPLSRHSPTIHLFSLSTPAANAAPPPVAPSLRSLPLRRPQHLSRCRHAARWPGLRSLRRRQAPPGTYTHSPCSSLPAVRKSTQSLTYCLCSDLIRANSTPVSNPTFSPLQIQSIPFFLV